MLPHLTPQQIAALIVVLIGAIHDLYNSKIPNWLTFSGAALGILLQSLASGPMGALWAICGWLVGAGISIVMKMAPVWLRHYKTIPIGFGDTKLIAAAGALLGPAQALLVYFYFCLWYGMLWSIQMARALLQLQLQLMQNSKASKDNTIKNELKNTGKTLIPIGPAVALGTACAIFLEKPTLQFLGF